MVAASYLDPGGAAVGLAVAAHDADQAAIRTAWEAVQAWSAAWRSRRLVVAAAEPCCANESSPSDACPRIAAAHQTVDRFAQRGDTVVLIGHPSLRQLSADMVHVASAVEVADLQLDPDRVSYLVTPGTVLERAMPVVATLRARYPRLRGAHPGGLCYLASDRLATVRAVATRCDRLFVLGDPNAVDTAELVQAAGTGKPVHVLDRFEQVRPAWLAGTESIGLAAARSTPPLLLHAMIDALSGMGPLSVVRQRVVTELASEGSWLPSSDIITTNLSTV
jgi:4-hydroxy-3-methylbut-2-enyl diphosphate reductase